MKTTCLLASFFALLILANDAFAMKEQTLPFMKSTDFTPFWKDSKDNQDIVPASVTSFKFKNQSNITLTEGNLKGHISLVNFFFTSCGNVCPRLMSRVQSIQRDLASIPGLRIYSISVMPEVDSPNRLANYAKARNINLKNWDLVTGNRSAIYQLGRKVFRADRNPDGTIADAEFIHTQAIYLVDADLQIRGIYQSDKITDMALLIQDTNTLVHSNVVN